MPTWHNDLQMDVQLGSTHALIGLQICQDVYYTKSNTSNGKALYKCTNTHSQCRYHGMQAQPLTLGHNCAYSMLQNLRAKVCHFFYVFVSQPLVSGPLRQQPGMANLSLGGESLYLQNVWVQRVQIAPLPRKFQGGICCGSHLATTYGGELLYLRIFL